MPNLSLPMTSNLSKSYQWFLALQTEIETQNAFDKLQLNITEKKCPLGYRITQKEKNQFFLNGKGINKAIQLPNSKHWS